MTQTIYPAKIVFTEQAEQYLEQLGTDLIVGIVELHQLTPALLQFWTFAFEDGRAVGLASREGLDRLTFERNLWFYVANNKGARPGDFFTHLTDKLWEASAE